MASYIYDLADTWNDGATTFAAIKMNVTDTASAAGSLLMDLQIAGNSYYSFAKDGWLTFANLAAAHGLKNGSVRLAFRGGPGYDDILVQSSTGTQTHAAIGAQGGAQSRVAVPSNGFLAFSNTINNAIATLDTILARDAAGVLAQRNGTNAQAFRLYNTFTDASNYERGKIEWASNVLRIGTEKAGTGTARALEFQTDGATRLTLGTSGDVSTGSYVQFATVSTTLAWLWTSGGNGARLNTTGLKLTSGLSLGWTASGESNDALDTGLSRAGVNIVKVTNGSTGGGAMQLAEMTPPAAPAADNVRIYAEDNGSGKTRLMALFATGAAVQLAIEP